MICVICRQAEIVNGLTSISFERGEVRLVVNSVPARVCPGCGEAYVEEDVAAWLLRETEYISTEAKLDDVIEYNRTNLK